MCAFCHKENDLFLSLERWTKPGRFFPPSDPNSFWKQLKKMKKIGVQTKKNNRGKYNSHVKERSHVLKKSRTEKTLRSNLSAKIVHKKNQVSCRLCLKCLLQNWMLGDSSKKNWWFVSETDEGMQNAVPRSNCAYQRALGIVGCYYQQPVF